MADIVFFPLGESESDSTEADDEAASNDAFLLNEGLDLLADFRAIDDRALRDSVRRLVKSMALSARRITGSQ